MPNPALIREKVRQAIALLNEKGIDAWLTFVRETEQTRDPVLDLILDLNVTWISAFILTAQGDRVAIVGRLTGRTWPPWRSGIQSSATMRASGGPWWRRSSD